MNKSKKPYLLINNIGSALSPTLVTANGVVSGSNAINSLLSNGLIEADEEMQKAKAQAEEIVQQIQAQEAECLRTIHTRYCILNGLPMAAAADVQCYTPDKRLRPNYREYWFHFGMPDQYFLMGRDLESDGINHTLNITFNKELTREGE